MSLCSELERRNVVRVGVGYLALSWLLIQIAATREDIKAIEAPAFWDPGPPAG